MAEQLGELTRTHTCGALRPDDVGADVVLLGWVHRVRDLGGLLFTSALCDSVRASAWLLQHHILRTTRRRLHRLAPVYLPDRWSA